MNPTIEHLINELEVNAIKTLDKIKIAIRENPKRTDFSTIEDGEHFVYRDIEFIRLGLEQDGVLCMTATPLGEEAFDPDDSNNWEKSQIREKLNSEFLALLDENDLLPFESDLIADNGDATYGKCVDKIGILSCDLYRKYRKFVPLFEEGMWTCTPWVCGEPNTPVVRLVSPHGAFWDIYAAAVFGVVPVCIFHL